MTTVRDFSGRVVLITGSSSGIGAVAAEEFSRSGAQVVITGRNAKNLSEVAENCAKLSPKGLKPLEVLADVSNEDDCKRLIDSTIKAFGKLDILVNNAGVDAMTSIYNPNILETFDRLINTNLRSVIYLTHLCVDHLERTKGNIINISSGLSIKPMTHASIYGSLKSALDMFTKCLALELGPKGIRVNVVNPGLVRTNFLSPLGFDRAQTDAFYDGQIHSYPVGRVGESIDIASAILFLASDESSFVTGINLVSDGGAIIK